MSPEPLWTQALEPIRLETATEPSASLANGAVQGGANKGELSEQGEGTRTGHQEIAVLVHDNGLEPTVERVAESPGEEVEKPPRKKGTRARKVTPRVAGDAAILDGLADQTSAAEPPSSAVSSTGAGGPEVSVKPKRARTARARQPSASGNLRVKRNGGKTSETRQEGADPASTIELPDLIVVHADETHHFDAPGL